MDNKQSEFDAYQKVFSISWLSNALSKDIGDQADMEQRLFSHLSHYMTVTGTPPDKKYTIHDVDKQAKAMIGEWKLVWGPGVYTKKNDGKSQAKNVVYVACCEDFSISENETKKAYVVAIAATNETDWYDWVVEDGFVNKVVKWQDYNPYNYDVNSKDINIKNPLDGDESAYISSGTADGVSILLSKISNPDWANSCVTDTLKEYLSKIQDSDSILIFTGHSLAGALSPTMALYMADLDKDKPIDKFAKVYTYPTAGATPGNQKFSESYQNIFPPSQFGRDTVIEAKENYQYLNVRLWNHYDVVPHGWAPKSHQDWSPVSKPIIESPAMPEIPKLYGNSDLHHISTYLEVKKVVELAENRAKKSGIEYYTLPGMRLEGTAPEKPPGSFVDFMKELGSQHVNAYINKDYAGEPILLPYPLPHFDD